MDGERVSGYLREWKAVVVVVVVEEDSEQGGKRSPRLRRALAKAGILLFRVWTRLGAGEISPGPP